MVDTIYSETDITGGGQGFDQAHQRYFSQGHQVKNLGYYIFVLDSKSGSKINTIKISTKYFSGLEYFNKDNKLYGLSTDAFNKFHLTAIDSLNTVTTDSVSEMNSMVDGATDIDQYHGYYFALGVSHNRGNYIFCIDIKTGKLSKKLALGNNKFLLLKYYSGSSVIDGKISTHTHAALKFSKVYACSFNSKDTTTRVLDSTETDSNGNYSFSMNVKDSVYLLADPNSTYHPMELPTWSDSAYYFNDATFINVNSGSNTKNFRTNYGTNPGGSGYLGGKVIFCYMCKTFGSGNPAKHIRMMLADSNGTVQLSTYTDNNGNFSFKNIAYKKYKIFVDMPKNDNMAAPVLSLTPTNPSFSKLSFTLYPTYLFLDTTSITDMDIQIEPSSYNVFPNPFSNVLNINYKSNTSSKINISVLDLLGNVVYQQEEINSKSGILNISINLKDIAPSIYVLKIQQGNKIMTSRICKLQ